MDISKSIVKKDHLAKVRGEALYVADYPTGDLLFGRVLHSTKAKAKVLDVKLPELPPGYFYVDKNDIPGTNEVHMVKDDSPVFADETVEYIGDAIGMLVGPNEKMVNDLLAQVVVSYEDLTPILRIEDSDTAFFEYEHGKGDVEAAFKQADKVYEETFETSYQDHAFLETHGMIAEPVGDDGIRIHGSMQCPYYIHGAVKKVMGLDTEQVHVTQDVTGGGFGGKEGYPSILASQVAVAARKANKPVRVIFDRNEDMEFTSKKHPSKSTYKVAVKDGLVTAMKIDVEYNSGAFTTLSPVVLQRGIISASGVYNIPNLYVHGRAMKTNTVPNGAFRGFGAPQVFFAVEMMMDHIANDLGEEALTFKERNLAKKGDATSTGGEYHFPVPLPAMIEQVNQACDYRKKRELYKTQTGRFRKGIGISLFFHGAGFTGNGERDMIKAVARLHKFPDGKVEILTANTDMGQGLKTTFSKIVANELNIPLEDVLIENPNTDFVPDSGPTAASRSLMVVGELLRRAAIQLREQWKDNEDQVIDEHYKHPEFVIPFDIETFKGDAYPTYAWAVNAVEIELDTFTGVSKVLGAYGSFDVGTPIDEDIVVGQMEGGVMQSIGHSFMEQMAADNNGRIRNNCYSDYIIPTAMDVPNLQCMLYVDEYPNGPYGAKGAGEVPAVGATAAYLSAMQQALGNISLNHVPFGAEDAMKVLRKEVIA